LLLAFAIVGTALARSAQMGCASSREKEEPHPAVDEPWLLKEEATRIFKLADLDGNGCLDADELKDTLKKPQFVDTAMENLDLNLDGKVSLREWLIAQKNTFDKSEAACKTALKAMEKGPSAHLQKNTCSCREKIPCKCAQPAKLVLAACVHGSSPGQPRKLRPHPGMIVRLLQQMLAPFRPSSVVCTVTLDQVYEGRRRA